MSGANDEAIGVIESIRGELRGSFIFMFNYRATGYFGGIWGLSSAI